MSTKTLKKTIKRVNKDKTQIEADMKFAQKVNHMKEIVKVIFPVVEKVDTIYDAQTVVNALSGFIAALLETEVAKVKLSSLSVDLSKEEDSKVKTAIIELTELLKDESAQEISETLERFGTTLSKLGAHKFLQKPMTEISIDDLIAK